MLSVSIAAYHLCVLELHVDRVDSHEIGHQGNVHEVDAEWEPAQYDEQLTRKQVWQPLYGGKLFWLSQAYLGRMTNKFSQNI